MLKIFRRYTKIVIWVVVGSFILWGGYSVSALRKEGRFAGEVFGKSVTFQEYNRFYRATQLFMPSKKPLEDPELLRDYTWQNIIYSREAKRKGIKITDEEVRGEISNILKQQGLINLTAEQYKTWLTRTLHLSPREFEEGLREFIRIQKLLRTQIASFVPAGVNKLTDPKTKEEAVTKQKLEFMAWTNDVNKRAALKDYLAPPPAQEEAPKNTQAVVSTTRARPAKTGTSSSRERAGDMGHQPVPGTQPVPATKPVPAKTAPKPSL
ncbi:MAG: SurA N-terminal domain-containing protein [Candidatus Omnitrophota bacterium]